MLPFFASEKIAKGVDVIAESLGQLASHRAYLGNDRVFVVSFHGASSSSGVQTIGGSYPLSRQTAFTIFSTTPFAM